MFDIKRAAEIAKEASYSFATLCGEKRNKILEEIASLLIQNSVFLIEKNALDIANAKSYQLTDGEVDRLRLTKERIEEIANGVLEVAALPNYIGETIDSFVGVNDIKIKKISVPFGLIAMIYEARPNVTVDAAALCIKTGNAVLLRSGKEAFNSASALCIIIKQALLNCSVSPDVVTLIEDVSRESTERLMKLNGIVDLLIPRGGAGLIKYCVENSTIPIIETGTGNCHIYVEKNADIKKAVAIAVNAKTQRTSVCNSAESLLIDEEVAKKYLPTIAKALKEKGVSFFCCEKSIDLIEDAKVATDEEFAKEFLDLVISIKVVSDYTEAVSHINRFGTHHSDCIVTENSEAAEYFLKAVDSACVYHNVSTRFTDGGQFGFGAEIGISTQKLHARGPMGLREMLSYKYIIEGFGQTR